MRTLVCMTTTALALVACGARPVAESSAASTEASASSGADHSAALEGTSGEAAAGNTSSGADGPAAPPGASGEGSEFALQKSEPGKARGETGAPTASKLKPSATHAVAKFVVIDRDKGPITGIVIALTAPDGTKYYTEETNAEGYAEVLVPVGKKYEAVFLALGRKEIAASVDVTDEPNQNLKLTLRYKRFTNPPRPKPSAGPVEPSPPAGFVLDAVNFDSGKATIRDTSFPQLDGVAEYLLHKKSARIEISGHTDNVGNPKVNKALSQKRAQACRDYFIAKGVDGARIEAVGYGDERPVALNDSEEGRQKNRRIEAFEL